MARVDLHARRVAAERVGHRPGQFLADEPVHGRIVGKGAPLSGRKGRFDFTSNFRRRQGDGQGTAAAPNSYLHGGLPSLVGSQAFSLATAASRSSRQGMTVVKRLMAKTSFTVGVSPKIAI